MKWLDQGGNEHEVSDYEVMAKWLTPLNPELTPNHSSGGKYIEKWPISFGFDAEDKLESVQIYHCELGFSNLLSEELGEKKRRWWRSWLNDFRSKRDIKRMNLPAKGKIT
jgi:hypothetical protein